MSFARIYLRFMGAMSVLFGLVYLFSPESMTAPTGFGALSPAATTDVRATYGGFQLGLGAFLLWAAADAGRVRTALVLVALTIGAIGLCRATGLVLDASAGPFHLGGLATETTLTVLALVALGRARTAEGGVPA
jgi:hypothetical protein